MNLKQSMELAGQNLLNCLCPTRNYLPYWVLRVDRNYQAEFHFSWPAHNIGRWWDAILRLENATGFIIPSKLEGAMLENLYSFVDNPDSLCYAPLDSGWGALELHSLRETMLAFNALVRYRNSKWAQKKGHQMMETIYRALRDDCSWDFDKFDYYHRTGTQAEFWGSQDLTTTNGRLIEALIWFYEATDDPLAMDLADRLARFHLANVTNPDGQFNNSINPSHTHSYLGTLRGLLLFGKWTNQRNYIEAVSATYQVTVKRLVKQSGFTAHDLGKDTGGETTSPGDAAQLALWLSRNGYNEFLDDAERIIRARILPSQITKSPNLRPVIDDGKDEHINLQERILGAFGGCHSEPHAGKQAVTDVTAADLHTLVDIYRNIVVHTDAGLVVNFHFDYEDKEISILSKREQEATVKIAPKSQYNMLIRIPGWTPLESAQFTINGNPFKPIMLGNFAYLPGNLLPANIMLRYDLPVHRSIEKTDDIEYEFAWRGDEIIGVRPNSDFLPFYPTLE